MRGAAAAPGERAVAEETAVAIVYAGSTQAVLMATPADLEDLAIGFSLTEGIVEDPGAITELEVMPQSGGIELRMWLADDPARDLDARRRGIVGPTGCGLCGVESLAAATQPPPRVADGPVQSIAQVQAAVMSLHGRQPLGETTRAVHAAGFWTPAGGLGWVREDVGRHNALDKLAGALARAGIDGSIGVVLLTSRVSVEMVQKTARIGATIIVAVSAPTALAIRTAEAAGITLIAVARADGFEIFSGTQRIAGCA